MADTIKRSRTETFEHTVSGLLTKRADLFQEAARIRDRLGEIRNDVDAIDRVLGTFGYTGDLDTEMPRQKRQVLFGTGELTRSILDTLRDAQAPMYSRDIGRAVIAVGGQDARDRKLITEVTRRVSKALRILKQQGVVHANVDQRGNRMWTLRPGLGAFAS